MTTDLIGSALQPAEERLLAVYDELRANVLTALAALGVAVTGLGLRFEHLIDEGV